MADDQDLEDAPVAAEAPEEQRADLPPGPLDGNDVDTGSGYVDLGSLQVPAVQGLQVRAELAADKKTVQRVQLVLGQSGLQVQLAAAPKSGGVWDEVRAGIREGLESQGGQVVEQQTRYGTELTATLPMDMPDGTKGAVPIRIIGREGPRWFARIDVMGPATHDEEAWLPLQDVLDRLVVKRGTEPRPRLDLLPLSLPSAAVEVPGE